MPIVARRFRPLNRAAHREPDRAGSIATVILLRLIAALLALPATLFALASGFGLLPLPYPLFLVLQRLPVTFPLHMIASGLALVLIVAAAFTRHRRRAHRAAGRLAASCVILGGATGLIVAVASEATLVARAGFFAQGLAWLVLLVIAIAAIRQSNRTLHARLMIAMACVASGALWLRLIVAIAVAHELPFDTAYGAAAWASWLAPLVAAGTVAISLDLLKRRRDIRADQARRAVDASDQ